MDNKILGTWEGNYKYLKDGFKHMSENFIIEILEIAENNQFFGTSIDITTKKQINIGGEFKDPEINFVKTYDLTEIHIENNKKVTLNMLHEVFYEGELSGDNQLYGTWFIKERTVHYEGKKYLTDAIQGSWSAHRKITNKDR